MPCCSTWGIDNTMKSSLLLFLDFDGVICDSIDECFLSSWIAFYRYYLGQEPPAVSLQLHRQFGQLRPYIRDGQDYLLIHQILKQGGWVRNQAEFDLLIEQAGKEQMAAFKQLFYRGRNFLLDEDFTYWYRLNHLYSHITPHITREADNENLFILSTKKPEYIAAIFGFNGIVFNEDRILYPGTRSKSSVIKEILADRPGCTALFVDDQIDHLTKEQHSTIQPYLASWGYIKPEWLNGPVPVLYPAGTGDLFRQILKN